MLVSTVEHASLLHIGWHRVTISTSSEQVPEIMFCFQFLLIKNSRSFRSNVPFSFRPLQFGAMFDCTFSSPSSMWWCLFDRKIGYRAWPLKVRKSVQNLSYRKCFEPSTFHDTKKDDAKKAWTEKKTGITSLYSLAPTLQTFKLYFFLKTRSAAQSAGAPKNRRFLPLRCFQNTKDKGSSKVYKTVASCMTHTRIESALKVTFRKIRPRQSACFFLNTNYFLK